MKLGIVALFSLGVGLAPASSEAPLPPWNADERARMSDKTWIAGGVLLVEDEMAAPEPVEAIPRILDEPIPQDSGTPELETNPVAEEFLAAYFEGRPEGFLVDPQSLLAKEEISSIDAILNYHSSDSSIDMYVYVFGGDQHIPGDVREEEIVERVYSEEKPAVVVYYYLGNPQRAVIYLSPAVMDAVSAAEQRRALESSVVQALTDGAPGDQLKAFLAQMSVRIYWMERMTAGTAVGTNEALPDANPAKRSDGAKASAALEKMKRVLPSWSPTAWIAIAAGGGGLLLITLLFLWFRSRAKFRFPEYEIEPRLGGEHAAGIGAVISFSSAALPPARQRDQVPDSLRRG